MTDEASEASSYLRLVDSDITRLKAQGPSRTYTESKEEEHVSGKAAARLGLKCDSRTEPLLQRPAGEHVPSKAAATGVPRS